MLAPVVSFLNKPSLRSMVRVNPASKIGFTLTRSSFRQASKYPMRARRFVVVASFSVAKYNVR